MAIVFGLLGGTGLWVATVWLLLRGGPMVGKHLRLLGYYFPGYRVSWSGSIIGFVYGALVGALLGGVLALVYNKVSTWRNPSGHIG